MKLPNTRCTHCAGHTSYGTVETWTGTVNGVTHQTKECYDAAVAGREPPRKSKR